MVFLRWWLLSSRLRFCFHCSTKSYIPNLQGRPCHVWPMEACSGRCPREPKTVEHYDSSSKQQIPLQACKDAIAQITAAVKVSEPCNKSNALATGAESHSCTQHACAQNGSCNIHIESAGIMHGSLDKMNQSTFFRHTSDHKACIDALYDGQLTHEPCNSAQPNCASIKVKA